MHEVVDSNALKTYTYKNSWMLYREARVLQIKQETPEDKRSAKQISNTISAEWENMTDEEKQSWVEEARILKEAHQDRIAKSM